jgi:hypothetical protein
MEFVMNLPPNERKKLREKSYKKALGYNWEQNTETRLSYYKAVISS